MLTGQLGMPSTKTPGKPSTTSSRQKSKAKATSETKPGSSKKVTNAAKAKQMRERERERSTQIQGLERARDAMGDSPLLNNQRTILTKEIKNLRKLKLDQNLEVEIERKKAIIERKSARLLFLEESRIRMQTEISQRQQELDKQKKELEELFKTMAADPGRARHGCRQQQFGNS